MNNHTDTRPSPIPEGCHNLIPYLTCKDAAAAIDFYVTAFGAQEQSRILTNSGQILHAALKIGDAMLMMTEEEPEWGNLGPITMGGSPVGIHLYCEDVNAAWEQAVAAGCEVIMTLDDTFWGERFGILKDPFGHRWSLSMCIKKLDAAEIQAAALSIPMGCGGAQ